MTVPRNITLPVVLAVWIIAALVAGYIYSALPWFKDYYEYYLTRGADGFVGSPFAHAGVATIFRKCYLLGLPLFVAVVGYGGRLVQLSAVGAAHLAWYVSLSLALAAIWLMWMLTIERGFYELLFPV